MNHLNDDLKQDDPFVKLFPRLLSQPISFLSSLPFMLMMMTMTM